MITVTVGSKHILDLTLKKKKVVKIFFIFNISVSVAMLSSDNRRRVSYHLQYNYSKYVCHNIIEK